jgi:hypothetical protein
MVFDVVLDSDDDRRSRVRSRVNEDELARFLENGDRPTGSRGDASARDTTVRLRELLADDTVWVEPSSTGADEFLAAIAAERQAAPVASRRPGRAPVRSRGPGRRLLLVAAAALVVLAGAAGYLARAAGDGDGGTDVAGSEFDITGTELAPTASAVATVEETGSGVAIELDVTGLPPAAPGTYYQAWLKGPDGLVTVGTFHMLDGDDTVELWAGVPLERYPTLTVTLQDEGAGQESSGRVVLSGEVGP